MSYRQNQDYRDYISQLAWELLSAPPNKLEEVARLSEEDGWMGLDPTQLSSGKRQLVHPGQGTSVLQG